MPTQYNKDETFEGLYNTSAEHLRRYVRSQGAIVNRDDIVQEAFARLYDRMGNDAKPIERERLVAYLYTIARNLVLDQHRQNNRATQIQTGVDDTLLQSIPDTGLLPEEVYAEKELFEEFVDAVANLPEKEAKAVKGLLEGKTFEIVALETHIQMPALKYRLRKAKNLLKNG